MKKLLLMPSLIAFGLCVGCNTGPADVDKAEAEYNEAKREAGEMVADAEQDAAEETHETRKVVA